MSKETKYEYELTYEVSEEAQEEFNRIIAGVGGAQMQNANSNEKYAIAQENGAEIKLPNLSLLATYDSGTMVEMIEDLGNRLFRARFRKVRFHHNTIIATSNDVTATINLNVTLSAEDRETLLKDIEERLNKNLCGT